MKLLLVIIAQLFVAGVLGLGIYLAVAKGSLWLLAFSTLAYILAFAKLGCLPKQSH